MRKSIEDITIKRTFYKNHRDAFGNRVREPYEKEVKRKVNVVSGWPRFGHYILDAIICGIIINGLDFALLQANADFSTSLRFGFFAYQISFLNYFVIVAYYFICEKTMQRTIGKFATDSVVINQYAEPPAVDSLIGRSFSRLVPFEAFSCLSDRGWHDTWSKTYVVKTEERDKLKRLLANDEGVFISDSEDILD